MYAEQYTAELRRSFAKALVSHNGPKNAVPSRLVASCVAQLAASPCESSLICIDPIPTLSDQGEPNPDPQLGQ